MWAAFQRWWLRRCRRQVQIAGGNSVNIQARGGIVAYHIDTVDLRRRADDE